MSLEKFSKKIGFTENELKTVLFLLFAALLGLVLKFANYETSEPKHYDYSKQDSLFNAYPVNRKKVDEKTVQKNLVSKKETFDFHKNKTNLNIKFVDKQILIDVNSATEKDLIKLPGVGSKTAEKIIAYRNKHGKFKRKEELMNVSGIGKKKFDKIKKFIKIN